MRRTTLFLFLSYSLYIQGCASTTPVATLEEQFQSPIALRNTLGDDWKEGIPYNVALLYANAARNSLGVPEPAGYAVDSQSTLEVPFAIWDYSLGLEAQALAGFVLSFGTGDTLENARLRERNRGLGLLANPNTHYFLFYEQAGDATPVEVDRTWDEAHKVFEAVHNQDRQCQVPLWTPAVGFAKTLPKNIRGVMKSVDYYCPHPLFPGETQLVTVQAWANPFDGVRTLGAVQAQCWVTPPRGERWVDVRGCGQKLAASQRSRVPETDLALLVLVVTPRADDPSLFEVVGVSDGEVTRLPPPDPRPEYVQFLATRPYVVD